MGLNVTDATCWYGLAQTDDGCTRTLASYDPEAYLRSQIIYCALGVVSVLASGIMYWRVVKYDGSPLQNYCFLFCTYASVTVIIRAADPSSYSHIIPRPVSGWLSDSCTAALYSVYILALGYWALIIQQGAAVVDKPARLKCLESSAIAFVWAFYTAYDMSLFAFKGFPAAVDDVHAAHPERVYPRSDQHDVPGVRASSAVEASGLRARGQAPHVQRLVRAHDAQRVVQLGARQRRRRHPHCTGAEVRPSTAERGPRLENQEDPAHCRSRLAHRHGRPALHGRRARVEHAGGALVREWLAVRDRQVECESPAPVPVRLRVGIALDVPRHAEEERRSPPDRVAQGNVASLASTARPRRCRASLALQPGKV